VLDLALALTEALAHLHAHGLVHRDIKPSNIIFAGGFPKLADIGLVTESSSGDGRSIVGTEGYLPPEGPGTVTADLFALSRVLYEALTGLDRRKFPELPADLRQWSDAKLAFELNVILLRAGSNQASQRYPGAAALKRDLERLKTGGRRTTIYFSPPRTRMVKNNRHCTLARSAAALCRFRTTAPRPRPSSHARYHRIGDGFGLTRLSTHRRLSQTPTCLPPALLLTAAESKAATTLRSP
jgi:serine/threonine protein kinase